MPKPWQNFLGLLAAPLKPGMCLAMRMSASRAMSNMRSPPETATRSLFLLGKALRADLELASSVSPTHSSRTSAIGRFFLRKICQMWPVSWQAIAAMKSTSNGVPFTASSTCA